MDMKAASRPACHTLRFSQLDREITTQAGESLFQSARRHGVRIVGACGGRGSCGTCLVHVREGRFERLDDSHAGEAGNGTFPDRKWVRACQVRPLTDCSVEVAPRSLAAVARAEIDSGTDEERLPLDATLAHCDLELPEPTLADPLADTDRIRRALSRPHIRFDLPAATQLPERLRAHGGALRLRLRNDEVIDAAPPGRHALGLAVDLGTTNVAGFLVDIESGIRLAGLGIENPQAAWGADLITRINHAVRGQAAAELREAAREAISALAHDLTHTVGAAPTDIVDVTVCGNTAMHHLLLGLPVRQLGRAPFVAAVREGVDVKARDLGLSVNPGAWVHLAPNIGGFVGGDHVTALLATESHWQNVSTSLVMDIGTNTEISLIHQGSLRSASSPSGPALEGGHISCGMRAAEGAIERVMLAQDGSIAVRTIGNREAVGLCGSGVLDALATLHRAGIVDRRGRIVAGHPAVFADGAARTARLAPAVHVTQDDVRSVQLAKAAIRTAVELLLEEAGLSAGDIARFIIAGAFGAYIDIDSGIAIGLFPALPRSRFLQVGNAAGLGVRMLLTSAAARRRAAELAMSSRYIELSSRSDFQKRFLSNIGFPASAN